jgi:hypothetical protein
LIEDRNKTVITCSVASAAVRYLEERGAKPLETEVPVCEVWVADVAAVLSPTVTELVALKFIKRRPKGDDEKGRREWWDAAKRVQRLMTALVEVKTSVGDFHGDKKWSLPIPVNIAYTAIPKDLDIRLDEIPSAWGVLEYSAVTECVRLARVPVVQNVSVEQQLQVVLQIAVRRDHHTRYERMREFRRGIVITRNAEVSRTRTLDAMRAMMSIVEGKHGSVEGALEWNGIKHIPSYALVELRKLWACTEAAPKQ